MAHVITINRPDVVALIEEAAERLTGGNKTAAVGLAVRRLLEQDRREGSPFGAHPGSVRVRAGVDLTAPVLDVEPDAHTGAAMATTGALRTDGSITGGDSPSASNSFDYTEGLGPACFHRSLFTQAWEIARSPAAT